MYETKNQRIKNDKNTNMWGLNNILLSTMSQWGNQGEKSENTLRWVKIKTNFQIYGMQQSSYKKEVYSHTGLPQETRKSQIYILNYHLKELEKWEKTKFKVSRRKEVIMIRDKI